jgi:proton glutamate symport protein
MDMAISSTTIRTALVIGLSAINISKAGDSLAAMPSVAAKAAPIHFMPQSTWNQFILDAVPENIAKSVAENRVLQLVVFSILFGLAVGQSVPPAFRDQCPSLLPI